MIDKLNQIIHQISTKISILTKKNILLEEKNLELKKYNNKMEEIVKENKNLKKELKLLKISKSISIEGNDKKNIKLYINKLIEDIDICISQINESNKI